MLFKILKNARGGSMIAAVAVLTITAFAAIALVNMSGTDLDSAQKDKQSRQAETLVNACLQASLSAINNGDSPDAENISFAQGKYTATSEPDSGLITCTATVGDSTKERSINANFSKDVFTMSMEQAYVEEGGSIVHQAIRFVKDGNYQGILTKIHASWNASSCAVSLECDGTENIEEIVEEAEEEDDGDDDDEVEYEDVGEAPSGKFWICHVPSCDTSKQNSLAVNSNGWLFGHSNGTGSQHSCDYLGPCIISSDDSDDDDNEEDSDEEEQAAEEDEDIITCEADDEGVSALEDCDISDGNLQITGVSLEDTTLFEPGVTPSAQATATSSEQETDIADAYLVDDGTYYIDVTFNNTIPVGTWLTITAEFADGSDLTGMVKLGTAAAPIEDEADDSSEESSSSDPTFEIVDNVVVVDAGYKVDLEAIGSAIQCGSGGPEVNVKARLGIDGAYEQLWDYIDIDGEETYTKNNVSDNSEYVIEATAYLSSCSNFTQTYNSTDSVQVKVLKNGDSVPETSGFDQQLSAAQFLEAYIQDDKVYLSSDQVIFLFELGTSGSSSNSAADFQDLVVLMTITAL